MHLRHNGRKITSGKKKFIICYNKSFDAKSTVKSFICNYTKFIVSSNYNITFSHKQNYKSLVYYLKVKSVIDFLGTDKCKCNSSVVWW